MDHQSGARHIISDKIKTYLKHIHNVHAKYFGQDYRKIAFLNPTPVKLPDIGKAAFGDLFSSDILGADEHKSYVSAFEQLKTVKEKITLICSENCLLSSLKSVSEKGKKIEKLALPNIRERYSSNFDKCFQVIYAVKSSKMLKAYPSWLIFFILGAIATTAIELTVPQNSLTTVFSIAINLVCYFALFKVGSLIQAKVGLYRNVRTFAARRGLGLLRYIQDKKPAVSKRINELLAQAKREHWLPDNFRMNMKLMSITFISFILSFDVMPPLIHSEGYLMVLLPEIGVTDFLSLISVDAFYEQMRLENLSVFFKNLLVSVCACCIILYNYEVSYKRRLILRSLSRP